MTSLLCVRQIRSFFSSKSLLNLFSLDTFVFILQVLCDINRYHLRFPSDTNFRNLVTNTPPFCTTHLEVYRNLPKFLTDNLSSIWFSSRNPPNFRCHGSYFRNLTIFFWISGYLTRTFSLQFRNSQNFLLNGKWPLVLKPSVFHAQITPRFLTVSNVIVRIELLSPVNRENSLPYYFLLS